MWRLLSGMMSLLGYDRSQIGRMSVNMMLYAGEMLANSALNIDTNNLDTEMEQYRAFSNSGSILSYAKDALQRSHARGEEIMSSLLDPSLMDKMTDKLGETTGSTTSCIQQFLCKMAPYLRSVQQATNKTLDRIMELSFQQSR